MKNKDIKKLTKDELNKKINLIKKDLFNIRFKKVNGQLQDTAKISTLEFSSIHLTDFFKCFSK